MPKQAIQAQVLNLSKSCFLKKRQLENGFSFDRWLKSLFFFCLLFYLLNNSIKYNINCSVNEI